MLLCACAIPLPFFLLTVNQIKKETCTSIIIPSDEQKSDCIRIEGDPKGVAAAKKMIIEMTAKLVRCCLHNCIALHNIYM